jgi:hypothetical protein
MDSEEYFKAKKRLNQFLADNPQLRPLQEEIDRHLNGAGNAHNRLVILKKLMMDKVKELEEAMLDLAEMMKGPGHERN